MPLNELITYIAHMFKSGLSHSTVSCYIAGISFHSKLNNLEDNTQTFIVRKMLDGFKRTTGNKKDTRLPINRQLLRNIIQVLPNICKSRYESQLFITAFSFCFHGMFRVSELTWKAPGYSSHAVKFQNVKVLGDSLEVFLETSKTDQFGSGVTINIPSQIDKNACPVNAVRKFVSYRGVQDGPLFRHFDGNPLTSYQFSAMLKRSLQFLRVADSNLTSHSFRIGMATACSIEGVTDEQIKKLGRWKSNVFLRYIRIPC